jgi:predicted DNA-binding transcriptional regulator AlpA
MREELFPQPIRIGQRRIGWRIEDLEEWMRTREVGSRTGRPLGEVL